MRMDMPHLDPDAEARLKARAYVTDVIIEDREDGVAIFGMCAIKPPELRFLGWGPNRQDALSDALVRKYRPQQLTEGAAPPVIAGARPVEVQQPYPVPDPRDEEIAALRARVAELEAPTPEPEPETHFADLMLADETIDDARARLSQRLKELRHYLIAPEIKVNEDGSIGLTAGEQSELQDLERRQTLGRWLDA